MKAKLIHSYLVFGLALLMPQFATSFNCHASEAPKTDEQVAQQSDPIPVAPPEGKLPHALLSLTSETGQFSQYAFLVDKKMRTLTVWQNDGETLKLVGTWPSDMGRRDGDKVAEGDFKTPEGIYFFQTMMDGKRINYNEYGVRIFTLDYPNYFDKLEGKTGSGIWFHAIPETKSLTRGSRGCVVVRNKVIEELGKFIELKRTPMIVVNQVEYMDVSKWKELRKSLQDWLETWRQAWGGKDLENYMKFYGEKFSSNGMSKDRWRSYKKNLAGRYEFINIDLKDVQIFNQGPKIVFRFMQDYKSNQKKDFGSKIIYVQRVTDGDKGQKFEIIGETWEALRTPTKIAK